ncbi:hypothetical protein RUM44_001178 [Polyplax serrata]|uniref:Essential protein Yae1 N-terminal domain-containing protein n=1 Tax=Polyplax serrata TaxID=468196 RepID=A0ABR1B6V9_POLSC
MSDGSDIEPYDHQIDSKYFGKLQDKVKLLGFQEGVSKGWETAIQEGFNAGYKLGFKFGQHMGVNKGILKCTKEVTTAVDKLQEAQLENISDTCMLCMETNPSKDSSNLYSLDELMVKQEQCNDEILLNMAKLNSTNI